MNLVMRGGNYYVNGEWVILPKLWAWVYKAEEEQFAHPIPTNPNETPRRSASSSSSLWRRLRHNDLDFFLQHKRKVPAKSYPKQTNVLK